MEMSQIELVQLAKSGDHDAFMRLSEQYEWTIRSFVKNTGVENDEKDDLYQEGLIGLYKATIAYNVNLDVSFSAFARVCIRHSIISALRIYYGKKNFPIRSSLSLDTNDGEAVEIQGLGPVTEPERLLIEKESYKNLLNLIDNSLSRYERDVLKLFLQGEPYGEISKRLKMTTKSVDNAIQRIRGKLKLLIET